MKKIILFGDSITAGYQEGYVHPFLTQRIQTHFSDDVILNVGVPGFTTDDGLGILDQYVLNAHPDFVIIFFGANDVADHHDIPLKKYIANLTHFIEQIGPGKCILVTPAYCDQMVQTDRPLERIHEYAAALIKLAVSLDVPVVDLLSEMEQVDHPEQFLQADGLHFNTKGYDLLTSLYCRALEKKMAK